MSIVSTPTLRKITIITLVVAVISFGAAQIHQRLLTPQQLSPTQNQVDPTPTAAQAVPVVWENSLEGDITQINENSLIIKTADQEIEAVLTPQTLFYQEDATSSKPRQESSFAELEIGQKVIIIFDQKPAPGASALSVTALFFPPPEEVKSD